jgi:hypothetical protein
MDRLGSNLTLAVGAMITGGCAIAVLSLGWYSWFAIGSVAAFGVLLTWPANFAVSRRINRQDLHWDDSEADCVNDVISDPTKPEV